MKNKIDKKTILKIDIIIIAITLIGLGAAVGYARPLLIAPFDDTTTSNTSILFAFDKGENILIDDNPEFTSPESIYAKNNLVINLKPGTYYWKVSGLVQSEVRKITILSSIDLRLRESGEKYEVVNSGNTRLNVDVYDNDALVGNVVLDVDESENVSGNKFIGGQDE